MSNSRHCNKKGTPLSNAGCLWILSIIFFLFMDYNFITFLAAGPRSPSSTSKLT